MQVIEYGKENRDTVLLLHGGGLNWWNYRDEAKLLQSRCHVVLPVLDGHAGSGRAFTSIEDNASAIISFIDEKFGGQVLLIGGLSLGAQILLEILAQRKDICRYALIESASVIPSKAMNLLIGPSFGSSYGLIRQRWFSKLQFHSLRIREDLFEDYYRDTCAIAKQDLIEFMKANTAYSLKDAVRLTEAKVHIFAGEKETGAVLLSVERIHAAIPGSALTILPGLYHGEFSVNHPREFVKALEPFLAC